MFKIDVTLLELVALLVILDSAKDTDSKRALITFRKILLGHLAQHEHPTKK